VPELPEVETVVRSLQGLVGRAIRNAEFRKPRVLVGDAETSTQLLLGRRIGAIERAGKFIVFRLEPAGFLVVHLGMTGKLLVDAPLTKHSHAIFTLSEGVLQYEDFRQFGRVECGEELPARVAKLGPDALAVDFETFAGLVRARKTRIKPLLLNQEVVCGMGNIYVDEALFRAGIHPLASGARIKRARLRQLWESMREVLNEAIASKGSSISDYVDADGVKGTFQEMHRVYQRDGKPCVACGAEIQRILVAQRGTHFCAKCQKR
jgi:formamidopyrimidine-DNA glycosylase